MQHTCNYCKKGFEGRPNASTCSAACRVGLSYAVKYLATWGITQPIDSDIKPAKQEQPKKQPTPKTQVIEAVKQPKQDATPSKWEQIQAYRKRHKFDV